MAYIPLAVKASPRITARPYDMFFEQVKINGIKQPRFKYIGEDVPEDLAKDYLPLSK